MQYDLTGLETEILIIFGCFALGYTAYYSIFHNDGIKTRFATRYPGPAGEIYRNLVYRAVMVIGFGIVPTILLAILGDRPLSVYGLAVEWHWGRAGVIAGLSVVLIGLIWINPGKMKLTALYPQMRIPEWSLGHVIINSASWALYLVAYELMFRGFMLQALLPYGIGIAVIVNIAIYVAVHVPKGITEAIGAIPFGLLVCYLTLQYGTIWAAFFLHLALATANSYVALSASRDMKYVG